MKGMLRWAYGIYMEDVFSEISYKKEKWTAGDMLFVYPGKNRLFVKSGGGKSSIILRDSKLNKLFKVVEFFYPVR